MTVLKSKIVYKTMFIYMFVEALFGFPCEYKYSYFNFVPIQTRQYYQ